MTVGRSAKVRCCSGGLDVTLQIGTEEAEFGAPAAGYEEEAQAAFELLKDNLPSGTYSRLLRKMLWWCWQRDTRDPFERGVIYGALAILAKRTETKIDPQQP